MVWNIICLWQYIEYHLYLNVAMKWEIQVQKTTLDINGYQDHMVIYLLRSPFQVK